MEISTALWLGKDFVFTLRTITVFLLVWLRRRPMAYQHLKRASSSCACLRTRARRWWRSDCAMQFTTADQLTWTTTCCHVTWILLLLVLLPLDISPQMRSISRRPTTLVYLPWVAGKCRTWKVMDRIILHTAMQVFVYLATKS